MSLISPPLHRNIYSLCIAALLGCGLVIFCPSRSFAQGHEAASAPSSPEPSVDQIISGMHEEFDELGKSLGGFSADEQTKLAAFEKQIDDQLRADPSKVENREFHEYVQKGVRDVLSPEHQKKFDEMMNRSNENVKSIATSANLRMIGMDYMIYINDHDGKFPADLGALAKDVDSAEIFLVSGSPTKVPDDWKKMSDKDKADWINKNTDFVYLGGSATIKSPSTTVIAYVRPEASRNGNIFLMADGSVQAKHADEAKAIIDDLNAGKNPPPSLK